MPTDFQCYLCGGRSAVIRQGQARDNKELVPLECRRCGLVRLSSFSHITESFYADSHMHDSKPCDPGLELTQSKEDNLRRFYQFKELLAGKKVLDFGCGAGGFMLEIRETAASVIGVEPERRLRAFFDEQNLTVYPDLSAVPDSFKPDVVSMFHVLEHVPDPLAMLREMRERFFMSKEKGRVKKRERERERVQETGQKLIIEVPSASDALLTLYESDAFSKFTYWSCHLYLFTEDNLKTLAEKAGFSALEMIQYQRYPLANHLHWLAKGKPGGQHAWEMFNVPELMRQYENVLKEKKICDTVIGIFQ